MRYLLDTTFAVDLLRGDAGAVRRFEKFFEDGDEPYVNEVVLCELAVGFDRSDDPRLTAFARAIAFVQPPPEMAVLAGAWRRQARQGGRTLDLADALIAVAAHGLGAPVITRNVRDFSLTPVAVETY